ncbi:hypothetical protein D3C84_1080280 [compost metagenome]
MESLAEGQQLIVARAELVTAARWTRPLLCLRRSTLARTTTFPIQYKHLIGTQEQIDRQLSQTLSQVWNSLTKSQLLA